MTPEIARLIEAARAVIEELGTEEGTPEDWKVRYPDGKFPGEDAWAYFDPLLEVRVFMELADAIEAADVKNR